MLVSGMLAVWETKEEHAHLPRSSKAATLFQESVTLFERIGDPFYQAEALAWLGSEVPLISDEEHYSGQALLKQSLHLRRMIGDRNGIAWVTLNLADVQLAQLNYPVFEQAAREALASMQ